MTADKTRAKTRITYFMLISNLLVEYKWPAAVVAVAYITIPALAGKTTVATVTLAVQTFATKVGAKGGISWCATAIAGIWALIERKLRRKKTQYLSERLQKLEITIDSRRSSSGLAPSGDSKRPKPWKK